MNLASTLGPVPVRLSQLRRLRVTRAAAAVAPPRRITLAARSIMKLENRSLQLCVLSGWIWITRDGCPADTVLGAGEVFEQRQGALVLVHALEASELSIVSSGIPSQNA